jgi:hypothetical protein
MHMLPSLESFVPCWLQLMLQSRTVVVQDAHMFHRGMSILHALATRKPLVGQHVKCRPQLELIKAVQRMYSERCNRIANLLSVHAEVSGSKHVRSA